MTDKTNIAATHPDEIVWSQKYRPKVIQDVIIPESFKESLLKYTADGAIPSFLFFSPSPGTGKTTLALAICEMMNVRPLFINASLDNSIDDIRMKVIQYATTASLFGASRKVVILDEADRLSAAAQDALKGLMEHVSKNCSFILTCNTKSRISEPLVSRCIEVDFVYTKEEQKKVNLDIFKRVIQILEAEGVAHEKAPIAQLINMYSPDNRKIISEVQKYAKENGCIDNGILGKLKGVDEATLLQAMKEKKYDEVKSWCFDNYERLGDDFYGRVFKSLGAVLVPQSIPQAVLIINTYQRYHATVPDRFVHFLAMMTELMMEMTFK